MNRLLFLGLMLAASLGFADVDPSKYNCSDLRNEIRTQGSVVINGATVYARVPDCDAWHTPQWTFVKTRDIRFCGVGYVCAEKQSGSFLTPESCETCNTGINNPVILCFEKGYSASACAALRDGCGYGQVLCLNKGYTPSACAGN